MPDAIAVQITQAVTAHIQAAVTAGSLSQTIILERSYADWHLELAAADGTEAGTEPERPRVDVVLVTTAQETELIARRAIGYSVQVDVAIRQRLGQEMQDSDTGRVDVTKVDELMYLTQQINELCIPQRLTGLTDAVWESTRILVSPLVKHLRELRQFTSVLRLTFRMPKAVS